MPQQLTITPKPFKSSKLAVPPSPFSPKLPITPPASPPRDAVSHIKRSDARPKLELPSPPPEPLNWLWQCHICNRVYQLGVTRRCLDDGHYFCAGTTTVKRSKRTGAKKTVRHKACASEFDYQGWKAWSTWRRNVAEHLEAAEALELLSNDEPLPLFALNGVVTEMPPLTKKASKGHQSKDCWNTCNYPSECRWGKQFGVETPVLASTPAVVTVPSLSTPSTPEPEQTVKTSFDDILLDIKPDVADEVLDTFLEGLTPPTTPTPPEDDTKKPSMDDLLESAKRRKRRSAGQLPSPLASNPPSPVAAEFSPSTAQVLQKAFDDFELDFRKSFGRASQAVGNFVSSVRRSTALEDETADEFVASLKKKSTNGMW